MNTPQIKSFTDLTMTKVESEVNWFLKSEEVELIGCSVNYVNNKYIAVVSYKKLSNENICIEQEDKSSQKQLLQISYSKLNVIDHMDEVALQISVVFNGSVKCFKASKSITFNDLLSLSEIELSHIFNTLLNAITKDITETWNCDVVFVGLPPTVQDLRRKFK